jgi:hypothetical protein
MRAYKITNTRRVKPKAWMGVLALALAVCSLAAAPTAGAMHSSVNSITGGSEEPSQPVGGPDYSSVNSITGQSSEPSQPGGSQDVGYASVNAITGTSGSDTTLASGSPAGTDDGFDWLSAAIGAAAAMSLVALGGAAFLTVRRRTAVSPSTASLG